MSTDHALDADALDMAATDSYLRTAATMIGVSDWQWTCARAVWLHAPHLADAVRAGHLPLWHAALLAAIARCDPAAAQQAEQRLTGERWRDSCMLRNAQYRVRKIRYQQRGDR